MQEDLIFMKLQDLIYTPSRTGTGTRTGAGLVWVGLWQTCGGDCAIFVFYWAWLGGGGCRTGGLPQSRLRREVCSDFSFYSSETTAAAKPAFYFSFIVFCRNQDIKLYQSSLCEQRHNLLMSFRSFSSCWLNYKIIVHFFRNQCRNPISWFRLICPADEPTHSSSSSLTCLTK